MREPSMDSSPKRKEMHYRLHPFCLMATSMDPGRSGLQIHMPGRRYLDMVWDTGRLLWLEACIGDADRYF